MGAKKPQTQTVFTFACERADPSADVPKADNIVSHEQIAHAGNFEHIAKARTIGAITNAWRTLSDGVTSAEFERLGYGTAIRRRARDLLIKECKAGGRSDYGAVADGALERLIQNGELPPRPDQVIAPPAPPAKPEETKTSKPKRSRKKVANG